MLKNMLKATVFATTMALATGSFYTHAFADVVYNRGSAAEPESVDPHKTSTVYEANILRDLFQGLVMQDEKANLIPGAAESWTVCHNREYHGPVSVGAAGAFLTVAAGFFTGPITT